MADTEAKKHTYVNTTTPVFAFGKYEYPNAGTVAPVRIYEQQNYVEKKNVDNVEIYKAYRALMDVCFDKSKEVEEADVDKAMDDFKTVVKKVLGFAKDESKTETPKSDKSSTETPKSDAGTTETKPNV